MFEAINEKTLYVFGACNILSIPFVWAFYPETNQRTLEEMDLLFSADSIFAWEAEKAFAKMQAEHPEVVHRARTRESHVSHDHSSAALEPANPGKDSIEHANP